jgi:hypothetical protein
MIFAYSWTSDINKWPGTGREREDSSWQYMAAHIIAIVVKATGTISLFLGYNVLFDKNLIRSIDIITITAAGIVIFQHYFLSHAISTLVDIGLMFYFVDRVIEAVQI